MVGGGKRRGPPGDSDSKPEPKRLKAAKPEDFYKLVSVRDKFIKKFQAYTYDYSVEFRNLEHLRLEDVLPRLRSVFQSIIDRLGRDVEPDDRVRFVFDSPVLNFPISLPFMRMDELTAEKFFRRIEAVLQSYKFIRFDETCDIHFVHMKSTKGGKTNGGAHLMTLEEKLTKRKCIIKINDDGTNTCLARAIVVGRALHEKQGNELKYILKGRDKPLRGLVTDLHKKAGVVEGMLGGIEELQRFQNVLDDYRLIVLSREHMYGCFFKGPDKPHTIYLHLTNDHYDAIRSMAIFVTPVR